MRRVLKVLTECKLSDIARRTALELVVATIPHDVDAAKAMGEALENITAPRDLQELLAKHGGRTPNPVKPATWAAHLQRTPAPPAISALNQSTMGTRNKKHTTTRRSPSVSKPPPVSTNKPTHIKRAASRTRSGTHGW